MQWNWCTAARPQQRCLLSHTSFWQLLYQEERRKKKILCQLHTKPQVWSVLRIREMCSVSFQLYLSSGSQYFYPCNCTGYRNPNARPDREYCSQHLANVFVERNARQWFWDSWVFNEKGTPWLPFIFFIPSIVLFKNCNLCLNFFLRKKKKVKDKAAGQENKN